MWISPGNYQFESKLKVFSNSLKGVLKITRSGEIRVRRKFYPEGSQLKMVFLNLSSKIFNKQLRRLDISDKFYLSNRIILKKCCVKYF